MENRWNILSVVLCPPARMFYLTVLPYCTVSWFTSVNARFNFSADWLIRSDGAWLGQGGVIFHAVTMTVAWSVWGKSYIKSFRLARGAWVYKDIYRSLRAFATLLGHFSRYGHLPAQVERRSHCILTVDHLRVDVIWEVLLLPYQ